MAVRSASSWGAGGRHTGAQLRKHLKTVCLCREGARSKRETEQGSGGEVLGRRGNGVASPGGRRGCGCRRCGLQLLSISLK